MTHRRAILLLVLASAVLVALGAVAYEWRFHQRVERVRRLPDDADAKTVIAALGRPNDANQLSGWPAAPQRPILWKYAGPLSFSGCVQGDWPFLALPERSVIVLILHPETRQFSGGALLTGREPAARVLKRIDIRMSLDSGGYYRMQLAADANGELIGDVDIQGPGLSPLINGP